VPVAFRILGALGFAAAGAGASFFSWAINPPVKATNAIMATKIAKAFFILFTSFHKLLLSRLLVS
jgi:hypothetical protein